MNRLCEAGRVYLCVGWVRPSSAGAVYVSVLSADVDARLREFKLIPLAVSHSHFTSSCHSVLWSVWHLFLATRTDRLRSDLNTKKKNYFITVKEAQRIISHKTKHTEGVPVRNVQAGPLTETTQQRNIQELNDVSSVPQLRIQFSTKYQYFYFRFMTEQYICRCCSAVIMHSCWIYHEGHMVYFMCVQVVTWLHIVETDLVHFSWALFLYTIYIQYKSIYVAYLFPNNTWSENVTSNIKTNVSLVR